ncbi:CpsD/CapB family tyrosine-protein kinase [Aquibacillus koreensis]|uniref:non-specific protein-tyrosine kinase n=1 Tax=Aquibacillus koreensis TaxID=279446 RepID=A0A9X3WJL2_9BACI|nr:CpsD/CapB family tyrosine-protein kinase [Aquibacillus koreensis]MCT2534624.1 CpsD/CapB family tyrosine-protein kinase [Aquibacillus koreensis]MDC3419808.1 CpsD/CapB family tyrosine-protein kinase [Aquibacillus koreensis]
MAKRRKQARNTTMRHLITKLNPRSPISEQYRTIRTNLQFSSVDNEIQSMLVTSSGPAEGKSSTVANLAIVFAQQGKKVLLIDADMRKPTLHYTFRMDNRRGLSSVLVGETILDESIVKSDVKDLDLLSCGPIPPNPSELLGSKAMERLIRDAKGYYDLIIFDTPPVLAVTDAQILANICDGAIMVVRSKQTEYEAGQKARDLLMPAKAKLLGVVLNDKEQKKGQYYYYGTN